MLSRELFRPSCVHDHKASSFVAVVQACSDCPYGAVMSVNVCPYHSFVTAAPEDVTAGVTCGAFPAVAAEGAFTVPASAVELFERAL